MQIVNKDLKIGVTGLGLIGGSIYKNLHKNHFVNIYAHTHNEDTKNKIINDGHVASDDIYILKECDVIFVCVPIYKTVDAIKDFFAINKTAVYVDVASLKENILAEIDKLDGCKFIGSHPMAGTENSGFDAAFSELFEAAKWVITPSNQANKSDIDMIKSIINETKAMVVEMDAKEHDYAVALISHAPMLISQCMMNSVINENFAKLLASSGFRDMTRLAMSNKIMAKDMLKFNENNIKLALESFVENANKLLDEPYFDSNIDKIIESRKNLYDSNGKNIFKSND